MANQQTLSAAHDFIDRILSPDVAISGSAVESAFMQGSPAIKPLAQLLSAEDFELARRARRALYVIIRYSTRPGAGSEAKAVEKELALALRDCTAVPARRQVLWMLSEIAHDRTVPAVTAFLADPDLREDARCVLMRIPGERAVAALRMALTTAPEGFKPALVDALHKRGKSVKGSESSAHQPS